ncbi:MAG: ParB N-terminal domain-containing protein [Planctomycetaceae bacterium]|nr:ParB N-terminal domain-containing protein [Planctomycetaceae bacterium]
MSERVCQLPLETIHVDRLQPAPYNPRVELKPGMEGYTRLKRSLEEFDLVQPIVWNRRTGHVISGHQRLEILKEQGVSELDVVVLDLPLEREQALNVTLNNPHVGGEWDLEKLSELMIDLSDLEEIDMSLTGFDDQQLKHFTLAPDENFTPALSTGDDVPAYRVSFEVPAEEWEPFRPTLDQFLAAHNLQPHIRPPRK